MSKDYDPASTGTPPKWGVKGAGWGREGPIWVKIYSLHNNDYVNIVKIRLLFRKWKETNIYNVWILFRI